MGRRIKRVFTWEAVLVGCLFALVIGALAGISMGLLLQSVEFGLIFAVAGTLFSIDVIFRGTNE